MLHLHRNDRTVPTVPLFLTAWVIAVSALAILFFFSATIPIKQDDAFGIVGKRPSSLRGVPRTTTSDAEKSPVNADSSGIPQLTLENYAAMTAGKKGVLVRFCTSWVSRADFGGLK